MTTYCASIPILQVATLPKFLLQCQVQFWANAKAPTARSPGLLLSRGGGGGEGVLDPKLGVPKMA